MPETRRIMVVSDAPGFGGHETVFLAFLPTLIASTTIERLSFIVPAVNTKFLTKLRAFASPKIEIIESPFIKGPGEPYLAFTRRAFLRYLQQLYKTLQPDTVLLLQGRIENLCVPMLALPKTADIVSYLPMAHSVEEMGKSLGFLKVPDLIRRAYYSRPQRLIVPSTAARAQLKRAGARGLITIARNVVPIPPTLEKAAARRQLGLPETGAIALYIGRLDTHQKGLDLLIRDLTSQPPGHWQFVFVGEGDGKAALESARAELPRPEALQIVAWTDEPATYLRAADALLLPSRYEGVPLVMLEAIAADLPILGSHIDVFEEYLPAHALYDFGQGNALCDRLDDLVAAQSSPPLKAQPDISLESEAQMFLSGLLGD
jgi:glycosyltransferase involved in cell wall biosynthesis